jgi:hypothetical protein
MLASKGRVGRLQRRASSRLCSPCSRLSRRLSGPPSSASSPFPYPYRVIGMVKIAFVGVATFYKPGKGATSILQSVIFSKPEAPVEERHTSSFLRFIRFLRSCMRRLGVHTRFLDSGG